MDHVSPAQRLVGGAMTGTSMDGIDVALAQITGQGTGIKIEYLRHCSLDLGELGPQLRSIASGDPAPAHAMAALAWKLGQLHAQAFRSLLRETATPDLIVVHGQTILHRPPLSWQMINCAPLAHALQCPVRADLRQADLAAGGEGAPLTPLADWYLYRVEGSRRVIVNLGGFLNYSVIPPPGSQEEKPGGRDLCACNQLLDGIARLGLGSTWDEAGAAASGGQVDSRVGSQITAMLEQQAAAGRSLGSGDECAEWIHATVNTTLDGASSAATAIDAIARVLSRALEAEEPDEVILAGGGTRNHTLVEAIRRQLPGPVILSDACGIPATAREALAIAVLGTLAEDGVDISLPHVTGRRSMAMQAGTRTGGPLLSQDHTGDAAFPRGDEAGARH